MLRINLVVQRFWKNTQGVTSIEYALLAALIAIAVLVAITAIGVNVNLLYTNIATLIAKAL